MRDTLERGLPALGLGPELIEPLERFSRMLLEKNQVMNLTAITDPRDVAALHLLDSLALTGLAALEGKAVVDVGTGAGFPGIPLAIARPSARVTLLDSLGKRRESFDLAVSRAVAALPALCELCLPLVKVGGEFWAMKSVDTEEEISAAKAAIKLLGGQIRAVSDYTIPTTEVVHRVVCVKKVSPTPRKYPRRFALIKKQPL